MEELKFLFNRFFWKTFFIISAVYLAFSIGYNSPRIISLSITANNLDSRYPIHLGEYKVDVTNPYFTLTLDNLPYNPNCPTCPDWSEEII